MRKLISLVASFESSDNIDLHHSADRRGNCVVNELNFPSRVVLLI